MEKLDEWSRVFNVQTNRWETSFGEAKDRHIGRIQDHRNSNFVKVATKRTKE